MKRVLAAKACKQEVLPGAKAKAGGTTGAKAGGTTRSTRSKSMPPLGSNLTLVISPGTTKRKGTAKSKSRRYYQEQKPPLGSNLTLPPESCVTQLNLPPAI